MDEDTVTRSDVIVVDDLDQAKVECGDLLWLRPGAVSAGTWPTSCRTWRPVGSRGGPSPDSITLFESMGVALEDIAAAQLVYRKAVERGMGQELPF